MANFTAADVKRLREQTAAGMMDCKRALEEADGDFDVAVELLRVKGAKDVSKRASRTAANGLVTAELDGTDAGVLLELNCETDFVAKTDVFQAVAAQIASVALQQRPADRLTLLGLELRPGTTVQQHIEEAGASLKEKIELGRTRSSRVATSLPTCTSPTRSCRRRWACWSSWTRRHPRPPRTSRTRWPRCGRST